MRPLGFIGRRARMKRSRSLALMVTALAGSAALVLIVPGCAMTDNRSIDVARLGSANRVEIYEGGRPVLERAVVAGSPEKRAIADCCSPIRPDGSRRA
jgi:hypothetical protein